jgi:predicted RNase H-like HicB family nuclease
MVARRFKVLIECELENHVWVTYVPVLDLHLCTFGETREEALENTREAILGYLEAATKEGIPAPATDPELDPIDLEVATA